MSASQSRVVFLVTVNVPSKEARDKVLPLIKKIKADINDGAEPGTLMYKIMLPSPDDPLKICIFEEYKDKESHMAHREGKAFQNLMKIAKEQGLVTGMDFQYFDEQ